MTMARVHYIERGVLSASDLNDEQAYLIALRRLHNLGPHDWGILSGLDLVIRSNTLMLTPGAAVDGYGRELYVPEPVVISQDLFASLYPRAQSAGHRQLDFWLRYARTTASAPQTGAYSCGPDEFSRWEEQTRLCSTVTPLDSAGDPLDVDPRHPAGVSADDLNFAPFQDSPDDPVRVWPVYLGRVNWLVTGRPIPDSRVCRPYAVLVGAVTHSASSQLVTDDPKNPKPVPPPPVPRAQMELAPALSGRPLFAIRVPDGSGALAEHLAINQAGQVRVTGHATVVSDLPYAERLAGEPLANPRGLVSNLYLCQSVPRFTQSKIADPRKLASKILSGRLPLSAKEQKAIADRVRQIFDEAKEWPTAQKDRKIRKKLARLLNSLIERTPLNNPRYLQKISLSQETWSIIRSWPPGADYRPLNARILAEILAEDLGPDAAPRKGWALEVGPLTEPPKTALPWRIYRVEKQGQDGEVSSELRFEIANPGQKGNPANSLLEIGHSAADGKFQHCLVVDAACNVTVNGKMYYTGDLVQSPPAVNAGDPNFLAQLVQAWEKALAAGIAANAELKTEIVGPLTISTTDNTKWSYDIQLTNNTSASITGVQVYDVYAIAGVIRPTTVVVQGGTISPGNPPPKTISHSEAQGLTTGTQVGLVVFALGYDPSGVAIYGSTSTLATL